MARPSPRSFSGGGGLAARGASSAASAVGSMVGNSGGGGGGQQPLDIAGIFNALSSGRGEKKPVMRRGYSGQPLAPDGTDPGNSFDKFLRQNPHIATGPARQQQVDAEASARGAQAMQDGFAAVQERKAQQEMGLSPFQQQTPSGLPKSDVVNSNDGFKTVFDPAGNAVGTNRPMGRPDGVFGSTSTNPMNPGLGGAIQDQFMSNAQYPSARAAGAPGSAPVTSLPSQSAVPGSGESGLASSGANFGIARQSPAAATFAPPTPSNADTFVGRTPMDGGDPGSRPVRDVVPMDGGNGVQPSAAARAFGDEFDRPMGYGPATPVSGGVAPKQRQQAQVTAPFQDDLASLVNWLLENKLISPYAFGG